MEKKELDKKEAKLKEEREKTICCICNIDFGTVEVLNYHQKEKNIDGKIKKCLYCDETFKGFRVLKVAQSKKHFSF